MKMNERTSENVRGFLAVALSLLLIPYGQQSLFAQQPYPPPGNYAPLGVEQLNQLVAPIALYPDALVAQVLTAATYPQQVADANNWMQQTGNMPPEQLAAAADTMPWDPSVKALTAFPSVLSNMARNYNWTAALGNAYYNQPGDVMNAIQAMRMRAQEAGNLRSDDHYRVGYNDGLVVIEPMNPAFVYVPYYNPWAIYGVPLSPWGGYNYFGPPRGVFLAGGFGLGFAAGISIGMFSHYGWGYNRWSPNWHGGVVVYNHNTYISRSTTVFNRGNFGGYNRGVYEHGGAGVPRNFRPAVTSQSAAFRPGQGRPGSFSGSQYSNGRQGVQQNAPGARQFGQQQSRPQTPAASQAPRQFGQSQYGQGRTAGQPVAPSAPRQSGQSQYGQPQNRQSQYGQGRTAGQPVAPSAPRQSGQSQSGQPQYRQSQYGQGRTAGQPVAPSAPRPQMSRPNVGGGSPQTARPQSNPGAASRPQGGNQGGGYHSQAAAPHAQAAPRPQSAAPAHQAAPARQSGGGGGHTQSRPENRRYR